ncbi:anti-sigma-I factor RsgI family protein [Neobacillus drentensis]|uniref:anti-sigma-I factor RsgI family protein n=1 Tax=Neobacillus drentensis TaxID=220684 RepID=UPI002FFE7263
MKKGIIMEIDDEFLTLLTHEGEFLHTRRLSQQYAIGEEIHFFPMERVKTSNSLHPLKNIFKFKPVWALLAAFVIMLGSLFPMYQNNKAYAYMSIDVNPSIELGINKKMKVVGIKGFNEEGKQIVSHLRNWKMKNVSKIAEAIILEMDKEGYLNTTKQVIIATVRTEEPEDKVEKELKKNIDEIKVSVDKQMMEPVVRDATVEDREEAIKHGSTTGKYIENKTEALTNDTKTKKQMKPADSKVVQKKSDNSIPSEVNKKQKTNKALQNKGTEMKKPVEKKLANGKMIPPGQLKKIDENKLKQNKGQAKKQNSQKGKNTESKKNSKQEDYKGKYRGNSVLKNNNSHRDTAKTNNEHKLKNKEKDSKKDSGKNNKKSNGNHGYVHSNK